MEQDLRRTIEELIVRYTLEPELRDLYVEGPSDKLLLEWFFNQFKCELITVFEINCVDIPNTLISEFDLHSGERDEVIALSIELERSLPIQVSQIFCVADSDFDFLLGRKYNSRYLLYTDYTSLDLYFWSEDILDRFFRLGVQYVPCETNTLLINFAEVLQEVFLIRTTNERLGWGL